MGCREFHSLSAREHQVLSLYAKGLSQVEAARSLGISIDTVKVHTRHIFDKGGINSIPQAVFKGVRDATIDLDDALSVVNLVRIRENSPLSPMRMTVLDVLTQPGGEASNRDIASALSISPNTVKTQLKTIFSEWDVTGRTQAGLVYIALPQLY